MKNDLDKSPAAERKNSVEYQQRSENIDSMKKEGLPTSVVYNPLQGDSKRKPLVSKALSVQIFCTSGSDGQLEYKAKAKKIFWRVVKGGQMLTDGDAVTNSDSMIFPAGGVNFPFELQLSLTEDFAVLASVKVDGPVKIARLRCP
jgi:hypothetical protein